MVRGLTVFKKYFDAFPENYVIIGGTACDLILEEAGFIPRATKDIDIILIVEALNSEFVKQFWLFIEDGNYERKEKSEEERKYYRFMKPQNPDFPYQIELFARNPDLLDFDEHSFLTPIPVDDDLTSLSAILMDDDYYHFLLAHSELENGLHLANIESLICLKAKAYLEIATRIANGSREDAKHLRKHKGDVFRLAVILTPNDHFELSDTLKADMQAFVNVVTEDLPDKSIFKEMGINSVSASDILSLLVDSFGLEIM